MNPNRHEHYPVTRLRPPPWLRLLMKYGARKFPDTPLRNLPTRYAALARRRKVKT